MPPSNRQIYEFGEWRLDPAEHLLLHRGASVPLTPRVFETLLLLVENAGRLVTKDEFMKRVWADAFVGDLALTQNISQLRKALGDAAAIETVPKKGYRFLQIVRLAEAATIREGEEDKESAAESTTSSVVSEANLSTASSGGRARTRLPASGWRWVIGVAVVVFFALTANLIYTRGRNVRAVATPSIRSLAVLPLQNLSGDPNQEYFADGMTEELITDLAQIHSLRVISRTSVMQFKHTNKKLPEIAAELDVDAVVEGSVVRAGNSVRVTAQLLDARRDRHLWAASYERDIPNILELQGQVARTIADQVNAKLTPQEGEALAKRRPTNPEAYDALLTGRFLFNRRNAADVEKALGYFQHAVDLDPNNAQAWAALGSCYTSLGSDLGVADPAKVLPQARAALTKALALNPNLAEAHSTLGWIKLWYDWDWRGAEQEFRRSLELDPNSSVAHRDYSHYLQLRKRFDEAVEENKRAIDLAPLDILPSIHMAWLYVDAREGVKAVEQSRHVLEMDPAFTGAYLMLAGGYELQGEWKEELAAIKRAKGLYPGAYFGTVAYVQAVSGNKLRAKAAFTELTEFSRHNYVSPLDFASYYAALGDRNKAFEWLNRAYRERATGMISIEVNDRLDNLRPDPRFRELERRVGF